MLRTELTHISGQRVVQGDLTDISNLVEILAALTFVATPLDATGECEFVRHRRQMSLPVHTLHQLRVDCWALMSISLHLLLCLRGSPLAGISLPFLLPVDSEMLVLRCSAGHYDSEDQGSNELAAEVVEPPEHSSVHSAEVAEPAMSGDQEDYKHSTGHEAYPRGALQHDLLRADDEQAAALLQPAGAAAQHWHLTGGVDGAERFAQAEEAAGRWAQPELQQQEQPHAVQTEGEQWTQQLEAMQFDAQEWAGPDGSQNLNWDHRLQNEEQQAEAGAQGAPSSTSSDEQWQDGEGADENAGSKALQQQQQVPIQHRGGGKQKQRSRRPAGAAPLRPAGVHTAQPGAARGVQAALNRPVGHRQARPHQPRAVHMAQCMAAAASGGALTRLAER